MFMLAAVLSCAAIDGDTLRCGREAVRLLGIDAPEKAGHCRPGRVCAPGDPEASRHSLAAGLRSGPIRIERVGRDIYGRTLAMVRAGGVDLSCWQLRHGQAIHVARWDDGGRVARTCPALTQPAQR
jgi:endonuclease YncB( thermonuclease family)